MTIDLWVVIDSESGSIEWMRVDCGDEFWKSEKKALLAAKRIFLRECRATHVERRQLTIPVSGELIGVLGCAIGMGPVVLTTTEGKLRTGDEAKEYLDAAVKKKLKEKAA